MSTILIGVDDSTRSEDAVAFGRRLAGATGGRVALTCAFPYSDIPSRSTNLTYRQALKDEATRTVRRMQALLEDGVGVDPTGRDAGLPGGLLRVVVQALPVQRPGAHRRLKDQMGERAVA